MTAHIVVSEVDDQLPVTLSKRLWIISSAALSALTAC